MTKPETLSDLVERLDARWAECEAKSQFHDDFQDEWPRLSASIKALVGFVAFCGNELGYDRAKELLDCLDNSAPREPKE